MREDLQKKVDHAKELIKESIEKHEKVGVACSFGKDSMVTVHLAQEVKPDIPVFAVMTIYKPKETFEYLVKLAKEMKMNLKVYLVANEVPEVLKKGNIDVELMSAKEFDKAYKECEEREGKPLHDVDPDACCGFLKVEPTKVAVKDLDAWMCGLRNTEGRTRKNYQEVEKRGNLYKINPILEFTEEDVHDYLKENGIEIHPWYSKKLPGGLRYRSLGCAPCTNPIKDDQLEREGRWQNTSKCGGECGIHTKNLK